MAVVGKNASTYLATKKLVTFDYKDEDAEVEFPKTWFDNHPGAKPRLEIPQIKEDYKSIIQSVRGGIHSSNLTVQTALAFVYLYGSKIKEPLTGEWKSFGTVIGLDHEEVTPWSLVTVIREPEYTCKESVYPQATGSVVSRGDPNSWTERAMVLYIVCIYRLCKIENDTYREMVQGRMLNQLSAEGGEGMKLSGVSHVYNSWLNNRNYLKMIAALDMFLAKFKNSEEGILRMGTLGSRYRDCAGLLSVGYALSILNIEAGELMDWIFLPTMAHEMLRIATPEQESGDHDSYFPYQADFGLVQKSAYSSNANPYLFTWIHLIGGLIRHRRSVNAKFYFEGNFADVGLNAVLVYWVFHRGGDMKPMFSQDGKTYGDDVMIGGCLEDGKLSETDKLWVNTTGRKPSTWFAIIKAQGFKVPSFVRASIQRQCEKVKEIRQETIGEYLQGTFVY